MPEVRRSQHGIVPGGKAWRNGRDRHRQLRRGAHHVNAGMASGTSEASVYFSSVVFYKIALLCQGQHFGDLDSASIIGGNPPFCKIPMQNPKLRHGLRPVWAGAFEPMEAAVLLGLFDRPFYDRLDSQIRQFRRFSRGKLVHFRYEYLQKILLLHMQVQAGCGGGSGFPWRIPSCRFLLLQGLLVFIPGKPCFLGLFFCQVSPWKDMTEPTFDCSADPIFWRGYAAA